METRFVPARYFLIAIVPIIIFAQEAVISGQFLSPDLQVSVSILQEERIMLETAGRFRFLGATWFFAALSALVFALALRDLLQPLRKQTQLAGAFVLALILVLAVSPTFKFMQDPDSLRNYHKLGGDLFEAALGQGTLPGCTVPTDRWLLGVCGDAPVISLLNRMMDVTNVFAGLGVGGLIVGMILCLEERDDTELEMKAAQLERNVLRMRRQLYLSGLVLTVGIFFATTWMRWPLPMIQGDASEAYDAVIAASLLFTGLYFSLLILSFYLPVAIVLDGRKKALAVLAAGHDKLTERKDRQDWLTSHGLQADPTDFLKAGFALVAPILAAYAGSLPSFV